MCIVGNYIIDLHKHQKQVEKETLESFSGMLRRKRNLKKKKLPTMFVYYVYSAIPASLKLISNFY